VRENEIVTTTMIRVKEVKGIAPKNEIEINVIIRVERMTE
jgi:hypothetical protein